MLVEYGNHAIKRYVTTETVVILKSVKEQFVFV